MNDTIPSSIKECSIAGHAYFVIVEFPSSKYVVSQVITSTANCILTIPVILLNAITVLTISKSNHLNTKICHFPVLIQSLADLSVGLLTLPLFAYINLSEVYGPPDCLLSFIFSTIAFIPWGLSLAALCALTFERYMGVIYPIEHRLYLTKRKFTIYVCCVMVVTLTIVPLAVASTIFYYVYCTVYAIIPMLLHTYCYSRIWYSARKKIHPDNSTESTSNKKSEKKISNRIRKLSSSKELKLAKSCALIVAIFYVCCVPGEFLNIYYLDKDLITYRVVLSWYTTVLGVNTILNSLIFFWTRPILRKEALKILKGMCHNWNNMMINAHGCIVKLTYSSIATPSWIVMHCGLSRVKNTIYKPLSLRECTIQEKHCDKRFLSYNRDMSINFLSILCHQFARMA